MRIKLLLIVTALWCCLDVQGQTLETLPEAEGVHLVLPSWKNLRTLLQMDEDRQVSVLQGYGYTALTPMWGYRRYSNTQEELPTYMLGQNMYLCDTSEVRCIVSLNLNTLANAVRTLKEELRPYYTGEMPDEDGYRIDIFDVHWQGKEYEIYVTNRPKYFDVTVVKGN